MSGEKFSAVLLQPHDTPLSQMLSQHRRILGELLQSCHALPPEHQVYPLQPSHCLVQSPLEIQRLKKEIRGCTIMPPVLSQGLLLRPVQLEGEELESKAEAVALQSVLPLFHRELDLPGQIPGCMVFGCIKDRNRGKTIDILNKSEKDKINKIIDSFDIKPLRLRVFRLQPVEYSWNLGKIPGTLTWTLDPPQWVKTK